LRKKKHIASRLPSAGPPRNRHEKKLPRGRLKKIVGKQRLLQEEGREEEQEVLGRGVLRRPPRATT